MSSEVIPPRTRSIIIASQSIAGFEIENRGGEEGEAGNGQDEVEHGVSLYLKKLVSRGGERRGSRG
jgi:hypothetical protein